jgi:tetratricopeptide (TPR) repeat protein
MMPQVLHVRLLVIVVAIATLTLLFAPAAFSQQYNVDEARYHTERGMEYFKKGFYEHAPKKQTAEAERNYESAIEEFKAAIAQDPSGSEAHRRLARVYHVQKKFALSAEEYKKVTELVPGDIDAYVNLALALIELQKFDDAVGALQYAKRYTDNPDVLHKLDGYISKIRAHQTGGAH